MLAFGNKEFRNLQEQVLENMRQIDDIKQAAVVLDEFGIKVIGQIESADELPDPETYEGEFGDAYAVGTEAPYELYIWTRGDSLGNNAYWFDIGAFPQAGPQGQPGAQGEQGPSGTISFGTITTTTLQPSQSASVTATNIGTASNAVYNMNFAIPKGEQGLPGETGATGATGPQGPKGDKGDKGDTGTGYIIMGQLDSALDLPDPGSTDRQAAYLIGANEPYDLYVIVGTIGHLEWFDAGPFTTSQADINQFEAGFGLTLDEVNSKIEYAVDTNNIPTHTDVAVAINSLSSNIASVYATKASLSSFQSDVSSAFLSVYGAIDALSSVYAGVAANNVFTGNNSFLSDINLLSSAKLNVTDAQQNEYAIDIPRVSGTIALTRDIPSISASYSGSYWTEMTLNGVTKEFGAGGGSGGSIDIDNKTIIENQSGELETAIGGWVEGSAGNQVTYNLNSYTTEWDVGEGDKPCFKFDLPSGTTWNDFIEAIFGNDPQMEDNVLLNLGSLYIGDNGNTLYDMTLPYLVYIDQNTVLWMSDLNYSNPMGEIHPDYHNNMNDSIRLEMNDSNGTSIPNVPCEANLYIKAGQASTETYHPIDGRFIPIDNSTILLNGQGQLYASVSSGTNYTAGSNISIANNVISLSNQVALGTGATAYFQSPRFRGEGDQNTYYHAIDYGYPNHDLVDNYEYGCTWNFWDGSDGQAKSYVNNAASLCLGIRSFGLLNSTNTFVWPSVGGTFATQEWVSQHGGGGGGGTAGVTEIGGATGSISLGTGLAMNGSTLYATGSAVGTTAFTKVYGGDPIVSANGQLWADLSNPDKILVRGTGPTEAYDNYIFAGSTTNNDLLYYKFPNDYYNPLFEYYIIPSNGQVTTGNFFVMIRDWGYSTTNQYAIPDVDIGNGARQFLACTLNENMGKTWSWEPLEGMPAAPDQQGTYVLKCYVDGNGNYNYSWESSN